MRILGYVDYDKDSMRVHVRAVQWNILFLAIKPEKAEP